MEVAKPPEFLPGLTPTEILNEAGEWLAFRLGNGFRWVKSRRAVSRTRGRRTDEIRLQPSKWNRAGVGTWATVRVTIRSKDLAAWRRSHPDDTLLAHDPELLWTNEFINVDKSLYFVELFGHLEQDDKAIRHISLVELLRGSEAVILPMLEHFESPQTASNRLPDAWFVLAAPLVEWAISLGDRSSARRITERMMRVHVHEATVFERGQAFYQAGKRPGLGLGEDALGWLASRHALFPPDEPLPWTMPPTSERERVIASGREIAERLRSELRHFQATRPGRLEDEQVREVLDLVNSWLVELTGQPRLSSSPTEEALTRLVRKFGIPETDLGKELITFQDAAARLRRGQAAKEL